MENKLIITQIVLHGNFTPLSAEPENIIELNAIVNKFSLFPKKVIEQHIEITDKQQSFNLTSSLELVSTNQIKTLQIRRDLLVFTYKDSKNVEFEKIVSNFTELLRELKERISFTSSSRIGLIRTENKLIGDLFEYRNQEGLEEDIIENRSRLVLRKFLPAIHEHINFVECKDFIAKDAGAEDDNFTLKIDINTLASNEEARFELNDIEDFLTNVQALI